MLKTDRKLPFVAFDVPSVRPGRAMHLPPQHLERPSPSDQREACAGWPNVPGPEPRQRHPIHQTGLTNSSRTTQDMPFDAFDGFDGPSPQPRSETEFSPPFQAGPSRRHWHRRRPSPSVGTSGRGLGAVKNSKIRSSKRHRSESSWHKPQPGRAAGCPLARCRPRRRRSYRARPAAAESPRRKRIFLFMLRHAILQPAASAPMTSQVPGPHIPPHPMVAG